MRPRPGRDVTLLATSAAVGVTALVGSLATDPRSGWYRALDKPTIQPPGWVFPLVWTPLYVDIALVSALALDDLAAAGRDDEWDAYATALAANLVLNAGWSLVFFRGHRLRTSIGVAAALAASSIDLTRRAAHVSPRRGAALSPYAAWTTFATVLTAAVARRND